MSGVVGGGWGEASTPEGEGGSDGGGGVAGGGGGGREGEVEAGWGKGDGSLVVGSTRVAGCDGRGATTSSLPVVSSRS